jgi:hypothetical protein
MTSDGAAQIVPEHHGVKYEARKGLPRHDGPDLDVPCRS